MKTITPAELKSWLENGKNFSLVDVREEFEHEAYNIGGQLIPLGELIARKAEINTGRPVVFYCEKGIRSIIAIQRLESALPADMYNLEGGMKAWRTMQGATSGSL